jgi:hypothetical protein
MARILRGDVVWADLNPVCGHESLPDAKPVNDALRPLIRTAKQSVKRC